MKQPPSITVLAVLTLLCFGASRWLTVDTNDHGQSLNVQMIGSAETIIKLRDLVGSGEISGQKSRLFKEVK